MRYGRAVVIGALLLASGCERVLGLSPIEPAEAQAAPPLDGLAPGDAAHSPYVEAVLADQPAA